MLLHGYDARPHDIAALGPLADPDGHYLIAAPEGPIAVPDAAGRAWFTTGPRGPDPTSFHESFAAIHDEIDRLCSTHLMARDDVVVGGFSQGGAMALAIGLGVGPDGTDRGRPAAVVCLSGYLADVDGLRYDWDAARSVPVLIQHGRHDDVVPLDLGADTASVLEHHGLSVTLQLYEMAHQTRLESLADVRDWLAAPV